MNQGPIPRVTEFTRVVELCVMCVKALRLEKCITFVPLVNYLNLWEIEKPTLCNMCVAYRLHLIL